MPTAMKNRSPPGRAWGLVIVDAAFPILECAGRVWDSGPLLATGAVEGSGDQRTMSADVEWTFPLEFVEVVWGDGKKVDRHIIQATDLPPFGRKRFSIPFNTAGKSWVRFAVWDSAGNPAFANASWLK